MAGIIYVNNSSSQSKSQREAQQTRARSQRIAKKAVRPAPKSSFINPVFRRDSHNNIPSLDTGGGSTAKVEAQVYTGTEMLGIGQMHKSNAVPIFKQEFAEDIAKMRR